MLQTLSRPVASSIPFGTNNTGGINQIMSQSLDQVREKVLKEKLVSEDMVDEAISEYRKFLCLAALGYNKLAMCSPDVDWVWHVHILFTKDYHEFCESVFGSYFHHQPKTSTSPLAEGAVERFFEAYQQVYGEVPPIWIGDAEGCGMCAGSGACSGGDGE